MFVEVYSSILEMLVKVHGELAGNAEEFVSAYGHAPALAAAALALGVAGYGAWRRFGGWTDAGLLAAALHELPIAVCVVRRDGEIQYANPALTSAVGDIRRRKCRDVLSCGGSGCVTAPATNRIAVRGADGRCHDILCSPIGGRASAPSRVVIMLDRTERYETEGILSAAKEAAEAASRAKTEFLAGMSHELRTPLNAIIGFADIMRSQIKGPLGNESYVGYAADICQAGTHLLEVINDILDISRIELGKAALAEEEFALEPVICSAVNFVRERAVAGGLTLACGLPADLPPLRADRRQVKQVLINVLSNAVKFTEPEGRVVVSAACDPQEGLCIFVRDTGIGIAPEDIPRALSPFGQIESALSRRHKGTGLGLPLSAALMEAHGGTLALESSTGEGTLVTLHFPAQRVMAPTIKALPTGP